MTDEGKTILGAIQRLRDLHRNVSLLLKSADAAMSERGWRNAKNDSSALHELSYSIDWPERWMPREVFRYYRHSDYPSILATIAVLLDDFEGRLSEPLISAALFDFGEGRTVDSFYNWLATIYKAMPGREASGEFLEAARPQLEESWQSDFERTWCFALPLVSINSETDLRQKVIEKLMVKVSNLGIGTH